MYKRLVMKSELQMQVVCRSDSIDLVLLVAIAVLKCEVTASEPSKTGRVSAVEALACRE